MRPHYRFALGLGSVLIVGASACGKDESPVAPSAEPELMAAAAVQALVFTQVSGGGAHTCGVTAEHKAYCWGANGFGRLGDGSTAEQHAPVPVAGGLSFRQVSAGNSHSCGVTTDNLAYCWGYNGNGELGDGTTNSHGTPVPVAGGRRFREVHAGLFHTCALTPANVAFCWGDNASGKLGDGTTTDRLAPVRVQAGGRSLSQLSVGYHHTCALGAADSLAYCWGANFAGELGDGTTTDRPAPVAVRRGLEYRRMSAGPTGSCAVTTARAAYCWGQNRYGQVGDGTSGFASRRLRPTAVLGGIQFDNVSTGGGQSCGLTTANRIYCWGNNFAGQLGDGTTTNRTTPVAVLGGRLFDRVSAGFSHTCGVTTGDRAFCWGSNNAGQLGDGTTDNRSQPVAVD